MQILGFSELTCTPIYRRYLEFRNTVFNQLLKYHHTGNPVYQVTAFESRDGLGVPYGVEYDQYDIPKTLHLAAIASNPSPGDGKEHRTQRDATITGCLRFLPTDGSYMIRDAIASGIWKRVELLVDTLPHSCDVYEASRIAVSPDIVDANQRKAIVDSLVFANVEIGVRLGVKRMVGIMYDRVWNSVYRNRGVPVRYLSKPFHVDDGQPIIIGEIDTSADTLAELETRYAREIETGIIVPSSIEPGTWMMHYYHVNRELPALPELSTTSRQSAVLQFKEALGA